MLEKGDKVDVYRNLRTGGYSVRKGGIVVHRCKAISISNPKFVVSEKGRQRVLKERQKNVHAVVRGEFEQAFDKDVDTSGLHEIYYNPYTTECFIDKESGQPIHEASWALMTGGKAYYKRSDEQ